MKNCEWCWGEVCNYVRTDNLSQPFFIFWANYNTNLPHKGKKIASYIWEIDFLIKIQSQISESCEKNGLVELIKPF